MPIKDSISSADDNGIQLSHQILADLLGGFDRSFIDDAIDNHVNLKQWLLFLLLDSGNLDDHKADAAANGNIPWECQLLFAWVGSGTISEHIADAQDAGVTLEQWLLFSKVGTGDLVDYLLEAIENNVKLEDMLAYSITLDSNNYLRAVGGRLSFVGSDKLHTFNYNADFTDALTVIADGDTNDVRTFKYGGGASGGSGGGTSGGGGAGGDAEDITETLPIGTYPAVIGRGGQVTGFQGNSGGDTIFNGKTMKGGSYGNGNTVPPNGGAGRLGGGGGSYGNNTAVGGPGGVGTKYNGGNATAYSAGDAAGGGAGPGGPGGNAVTTTAGPGGLGVYSDITGSNVGYCGGGAGSADLGGTPGDAVADFGGGDGNVRGGREATNGVRGGGGGGFNTGALGAGHGGDGELFVRYPHSGITSSLTEIFTADPDYSRYDGPTIVQRADNTYLMGITVFGTGSGDFSGSVIEFYSMSTLDSVPVYLSTISPFGIELNTICPNLYVAPNGDIYCIYLNTITNTTSRLLKRKTTDGGITWNAYDVVRENSGEYINIAPRKMRVTSTGRVLMNYSVCQGSDLGNDAYLGYTLISDDHLVTTSDAPGIITSPQNQVLEGDYVIIGTTIRAYWRGNKTAGGASNANKTYFADSTDDGDNFGTPFETGLPTINAMLTIETVSNGYIACYNSGTRETIEIAFSFDCEAFTNYYNINHVSGEQLIEPFIEIINGYAYIFYTISSASQTLLSLYKYKIKLTDYA